MYIFAVETSLMFFHCGPYVSPTFVTSNPTKNSFPLLLYLDVTQVQFSPSSQSYRKTVGVHNYGISNRSKL